MAISHDFQLQVLDTGLVIDVYDAYDIILDMFNPGNPWAFTLWRSSPDDTAAMANRRATSWSALMATVKLGQQVAFSIDGAVQLNGRIEEMRVTKSRGAGAALTISGRDLAGPAIDWDADPRVTLRGVTLEVALTELFNRVGIAPVIGADVNAAQEVQGRVRPGARGASTSRHPRRQRVDIAHARPGERVWQVAESIVRRMGYMMWVAPTLDRTALYNLAVVVDVPHYDQPAQFEFRSFEDDHGRYGPETNVLESAFTAQIRDIPTYVYAMGRAARGDQLPGRHRVERPNLSMIELLARGTGATAETISAGEGSLANVARHLARGNSTGAARDTREFGALVASLAGSVAALLPPPGDPGSGPAGGAPGPGGGAPRLLANPNRGLVASELVQLPLPPQPRFLHTATSRDPEHGAQEADLMMARAMRDFRTATILTQGHGQDINGERRVFTLNTMATMRDRVGGATLLNEDMLITRIQFSGGRKSGQTTRLTLGTAGAIVLCPEREDGSPVLTG